MTDQPDGGPAFPNPALADEGFFAPYDMSGMTLRDWFAGHALSGMISGSAGIEISTQQFAQQSYKLADAMIAARDGKTT